MNEFLITSEPICTQHRAEEGSGAFLIFEGRVRNQHQGRSVVALEYECEETLCNRLGITLLNEAQSQFGVHGIRMVHRMGHLELGELALWVEVQAPHRREAFEACEWVIDEVKRRLPIWKKEHYAEGDSGWVGTDTAPSAAPVTEALYFDRQVRLPEVGLEGQQRLRQAKVLVIGVGGLGCATLPYLAAAGIGHLTLCDGDRVDATNLHRQVLFGAGDVGKAKVKVAESRLRALTPFSEVSTVESRFTAAIGPELLSGHDLVIDGTDNFASKFLIHDLARQLQIPLIQASIYQSEGQLALYLPASDAGCLRCQWAETPPSDCVGNCAEVGVFGAVAGVFGAMMASVAIQQLLGMASPLATHTAFLDLFSFDTHLVRRIKHRTCPLCFSSESDPMSQTPELEIDLATFPSETFDQYTVLDVREVDEDRPTIPRLTGEWKLVPLSQFPEVVSELDKEQPYFVVCKGGVRSLRAVRQLRDMGFDLTYSVIGGATANG